MYTTITMNYYVNLYLTQNSNDRVTLVQIETWTYDTDKITYRSWRNIEEGSFPLFVFYMDSLTY